MFKKRYLLKLSGEALSGNKGFGFSEDVVMEVAKQVKELIRGGAQISIVIGGGNFWRGRSSETIDRTKADQIGMMATVMNCIYVSEIFRHIGLKTSIYTPFAIGSFTELFLKEKAIEDMKNNKVVFFAGGTGHPYFSTDTTTTLRAIEIEADEILLAKAIDGVYDSDPKTNPNAKRYDKISITEVVKNQLKVMDLTATILLFDNPIQIRVFDLREENSIVNSLNDDFNGTLVTIE